MIHVAFSSCIDSHHYILQTAKDMACNLPIVLHPPTDKRNNEEFRPTDKPKSAGDRTQMFKGLM